MVAGLEVFNDQGRWLIDGNTPNMVFLQKGTAVDSITFFSPSYPMVFVRPDAGYMMGLTNNGNGSYTYRCKGSFAYWIFTNKVDPNAQGYGLQIFDEAGRLLYGSFENPLKIHAMSTYARGAVPAPGAWHPEDTYRRAFGTPVASVSVPNPDRRLLAYAPNANRLRGVFVSSNGSYTYGQWWGYAETFVATDSGYRIEETRLWPAEFMTYNEAAAYFGDRCYWGWIGVPSTVDSWYGQGPMPPRISNQSFVLVADVTDF